jgi:hypothetical protein
LNQEPTVDADLVPSDPKYIAVGQPTGSHRHFVDSDASLPEQVNNPQAR